MGRNNTKTIKSISRMYDQMNMDSNAVLHKSKLLLGVYRDVVWVTLQEANYVREDLTYYGNELNDALIYLESFAPEMEKEQFEQRISGMFENKWMIDLVDKAMAKIYDYYNNGRLYHEILSKCYLTAFRYTESEILELLNMERSTFYDRKKEAILLFGISLWGYAIPSFRGVFTSAAMDDVPDFFKSG